MTHQPQTQVFYQPACGQTRAQVIDFVALKDGKEVGLHTQQSLEVLALRYPGLMIGDEDTVFKDIQDALILAPVEIEEAEFINMLGVLPPLDYCVFGGCSTFKLGEFYSGSITYIFAHVDDRFYRLRHYHTLPHQEIVSLVRASAVQLTGVHA